MNRRVTAVLICTFPALVGATVFVPTHRTDTNDALKLELLWPGTARHSQVAAWVHGWRNFTFKPLWLLRDEWDRDWRGQGGYQPAEEWHRSTGWIATPPPFRLAGLPGRWRAWFATLGLVPLLGGLLALFLRTRAARGAAA